MANTTLGVKGNKQELSHTSVAATTSTDFSAETITPDRDCVIRSVFWEKPADCDLTITLESDPNGSTAGADVVLVEENGADANTSGAAGAGRPIPFGGRLSITTTKTTAGTVTITPVVSPADTGV